MPNGAINRIFITCLLLLSAATMSYAGPIEDLERFYQNTQTLQTEFRQLQIDENGAVSKTQEGRFWMQRPNKLRWVYERPYKQVLVNDGQQFWLYDEDLAQVTVRPSREALQNAPMMLLSGGPELTEKFKLQALPAKDDMTWVGIEPHDKEGDFVAARMGLRNGLPAVLELSDSLDQQTRILFINLRVNQSVDAARFQFVVPEDVEVIGDSGSPDNAG